MQEYNSCMDSGDSSGSQNIGLNQDTDSRSVGAYNYNAVLWDDVKPVALMTVWWCYLAVTVHLVIRSGFRDEFTERPFSILNQYVALFKQVEDGEYNSARSSLLAVLGAIVTLALMLRGLESRSQDLPKDSQAHCAWLHRVMCDMVRENWIRNLLLLLCGAYGFIVACYGFLVGARGWKGLSLVFFLTSLALYVVVASLPAFVVKGDAEAVGGYVRAVKRVVTHAEWRIRNGSDDSVADNKNVLKIIFSKKTAIGFVSLEFIPAIIAIIVMSFRAFRDDGGVWGLLFVALWLLTAAFWLSATPLLVLYLKSRTISKGKSAVFELVLSCIFIFAVSLVTWITYVSLFSGLLGCVYRIISVVSLVCWFLLIIVSLFLGTKGLALRENKGLCACLAKAKLSVERWMGLRGVMCVLVDSALLKDRKTIRSYGCSEEGRIVEKMSVAAGLVVPEGYVIKRERDGGQVEEKNLREYLSEVVKVTLPPVLDTGSCTGKQGEWERTPLARTALCR